MDAVHSDSVSGLHAAVADPPPLAKLAHRKSQQARCCGVVAIGSRSPSNQA